MTDVFLNELILREAESSRASLAAYIRGLASEEFDWRPDEGIPSARHLVGALLDGEWPNREAVGGHRRKSTRGTLFPSSPKAAADLLRAERMLTTTILGENQRTSGAIMLALLLADTRVMAGVIALQRLIDPTRVLPV